MNENCFAKALLRLTIGDMVELHETSKLSVKDAMPKLRDFGNRHGLDDRQTLKAVGLSKHILDNYRPTICE